MRIAWFDPHRPEAALDASDALDLAAELAHRHSIDRFDQQSAYDFVPQHFRRPYDLTVFELGDSAAYEFIWAYLFHYPGIVRVHATSVQRSRAAMLQRMHRTPDLRAERRFSGLSMLTAPLAASKLIVTHDELAAAELAARAPGVSVVVLPVGVTARHVRPGERTRFVIAGTHQDVAARAAARAREAGVEVVLAADPHWLHASDVVIALEWPPTGAPPVAALQAMASGLAAIVLETHAIAHWPTLNPQSWQPRGYLEADAAVAVSIDPRDEEHSLMLAMLRLSRDAGLRSALGAAAARWAARHAALSTSAAAWDRALLKAAGRVPATGHEGLPRHLTEDGTARVRALLAEMGVTVDILDR